MAHEWTDNKTDRLSFTEKRKCSKCGAEQSYVDDGEWMRIKMRWLPLVGRCPNDKKVTHKPEYYKSGPNDAYWNVRCSCGWSSTPSFRIKKRQATGAFDGHKAQVSK